MDLMQLREIPRRKFVFLGLAILLVIVMAGIVVREKYPGLWTRIKGGVTTDANGDVVVPTIIGGELVLPKVAGLSGVGNLGNAKVTGTLGVLSANLIGILDPQTQQLSSIRIVGEVVNPGTRFVSAISPVIRFFDASGKTAGQKVADLSSGFEWHDLGSGGTTYYDVTVNTPPASDKLEIVLNAASSSDSALFEPLLIASRSMEIKVATYQNGQQTTTPPPPSATNSAGASTSGQATVSATPQATNPDQIEYYTVSGGVFNPFPDPVTDIAVYTWVKDASGKVFGFGSQVFKNDLIMSNDTLNFHMNILPLRNNQKYDNYEIQAWGRRYKLNF